MVYTLSNYAADRYFPYAYFGGIWPTTVGIIIEPSAFLQNVEFGTPQLNLEIRPNSFVEDIDFGIPNIMFGSFVYPPSVVTNVEFGIPTIGVEIRATSFSQDTIFGTPQLNLEIDASGIIQSVEFGTPELQLEGRILPSSILQDIVFGIPRIYSPAYPLELSIRLVSRPEIADSNTRPTPPTTDARLLPDENEIVSTSEPQAAEVVAKPTEETETIAATKIQTASVKVKLKTTASQIIAKLIESEE